MSDANKRQPGQQYNDSPQNMSPTERAVFGALGLGLISLGVVRRDRLGTGLGVVGAIFAGGAAMGKSPYNAALKLRRTRQGGGIHVQKAITIGKPKGEVYSFWRSLENLPRFMDHLQSVTQRDEELSHWVAKGPAGTEVSWDARITADEPGRLIAWKAVEGSTIPNEGRVEFKDAPGGRGTEVRVELQYFPPGGTLGAGFARLFGEEPSQQIGDDLTNLKRLMEVGSTPTTEGQSSGRASGGAIANMTARLVDHNRPQDSQLPNVGKMPSNEASDQTGNQSVSERAISTGGTKGEGATTERGAPLAGEGRHQP